MIDGVTSQGGADGSLFQKHHRSRESAGPQDNCQIVSGLRRKIAADLRPAPFDLLPDHRSRIDLLVQDDGHALADVFTRQLGKLPRPLTVEVYGDQWFVELLVEIDPGVGQEIS